MPPPPQTITIPLTDLVKLLDDIHDTKQLATALKVELEEIIETRLAYVSDLDIFEGARAVLDEARKKGL